MMHNCSQNLINYTVDTLIRLVIKHSLLQGTLKVGNGPCSHMVNGTSSWYIKISLESPTFELIQGFWPFDSST